MAEATLVLESPGAKFTASTDLSAGEIIKLPDGRAGVVAGQNAVASGDVYEAYTLGRFRVDSASATVFAVGERVYWDASADVAIRAGGASGDLYLGRAAKAKVNGDTTVLVDFGVVGMDSLNGIFSTPVFEIDHADATPVECIAAADNPNGLLLLSLIGEVTEQTAGASEDQMIVTFQDEDDTAIDTLTSADSSADAIGDLLVGPLGAFHGSSGGVMPKLAADKAGEFSVTQATSGSGLAGKIKCRAIVALLN